MARILITGGAGMIGSNIAGRLAARGDCDIVVCDWLGQAHEAKWKNLARHPITDFIAPEHLFAYLDGEAGRIEAVVHMGAISSTTETDVDLIVRTNINLSRALWDWCAAHRKPLVYASSAATYGDGAGGFEDDNSLAALEALEPLNAYGWSKKVFDIYAVRAALKGHAPPHWAGLKFFNVYGPNEHHKGGMKSVVAQIHPDIVRSGRVSLFKSHRDDYEDGGQKRDFIYVADAVAVVMWLLDTPSVSGLFNLGTGRARGFLDLANAVFAAVGRPPAIAFVDMPESLRGRYQYRTEARMERLRAAGFPGQFTSLEDGIARYVRALRDQGR